MESLKTTPVESVSAEQESAEIWASTEVKGKKGKVAFKLGKLVGKALKLGQKRSATMPSLQKIDAHSSKSMSQSVEVAPLKDIPNPPWVDSIATPYAPDEDDDWFALNTPAEQPSEPHITTEIVDADSFWSETWTSSLIDTQNPELSQKLEARKSGEFSDPRLWEPEAIDLRELFAVANTVDAEALPSHNESLTDTEIVRSLVEGRVVKKVPSLTEVAADAQRENHITRIAAFEATGGRLPNEYEATITETEQQAAADLVDFLKQFVEAGQHAEQGPSIVDEVARAQDMLENLTFIGETERLEAVKGLAAFWKSYLRENPANQICVVAGMRRSKKVKSGEYLLNNIIGEFSDEELIEFQGRLVTELAQLTAEPEDAKVILLDDWIISGMQMTETIENIHTSRDFSRYSASVEINLVTCSRTRLEQGFDNGTSRTPVRSYYLSKDAAKPTGYDEHGSYETGAHSSVDYDFEQGYIHPFLYKMYLMKEAGQEGSESLPSSMPGLTTIVRPYRNDPLVHLRHLEELARESQSQKVGV